LLLNNTIKKVLVMCLSDPSCDPRPNRMLELCSSLGLTVSTLCYDLKKLVDVDSYYNISCPSSFFIYRFLRRFWTVAVAILPSERARVFCENKRFGLSKVKNSLLKKKFDLLIVEDLQLLPLAFAIKGSGKILFDAREYYPKQNEGELWFELLEKKRRVHLCRTYMARCDAVVTVSEGLRREYMKEFGVAAEVYRSTPSYTDFSVRPVNPEKIRIVYHGAANRNRQLEKLIELASLLDERFSLDLILIGNPKYQAELRSLARCAPRIAFPVPVPLGKIIPTIGQYDIGLCYFEPTTFNLQNCLPNKFFESIQARLLVATGPTPDMAALVSEHGCGVVTDSFSIKNMAGALNSLTPQEINKCKEHSDRAARELCFEKECKKMVRVFVRLFDNQGVNG